MVSASRGRDTAPELLVRQILRHLRVRYRSQAKHLPGNPDLVCVDRQTAIFVNGCFWHSHRGCSRATLPKVNRAFWKRKIQGNVRRDNAAKRELKSKDWEVVVLWTCQLRDRTQVATKLERMLTNG